MYNKDLRTAAYSTAWLEGRGRLLLQRQTTGTFAQQTSTGIAGELAAINAELVDRYTGRSARPPAPRWLPPTPTLAPRPVGGYTGAFRSVTADFNPAPHSQYR